MQRICRNPWCHQPFEVTETDLAFYEKVSPMIGGTRFLIPIPSLCPTCRIQRRLTWRNERTLYQRSCDLCKKSIIAIYDTSAPFPVYCNDCWWGDNWNALSFGQPYDPNRSFSEQMQTLRLAVPRNALYLKNAVNSDYCNHSLYVKNSYLCVCIGGESENGYYSKWIIKSRDIADSYQLIGCELCYESLYTNACYNCIAVNRSEECRDCAFLYDCNGCSDCLCCWNLRHKRFCIENVQYSEEEYRERRAKVNLGSHRTYQDVQHRFASLIQSQSIRQALFNKQCENSSGDFLVRCKNVHDSFDVENAEDCRFCYGSESLKDCYEINEAAFGCELQYECQSCDGGKRTLLAHTSYNGSDLCCTDSCHSCKNLFGCIGLHSAEFCILNRQYTKAEYESLVPKIIERMKGDTSWGEFFSVTMSPFAYNETVAMEYFPLSREEVIARGWRWRERVDEMPKVDRVIPANQLPDSIEETPDDILHWAIECDVTKRPFKIIKQELEFYRQMRLPIPRLHPDERHRRRMALRNPRKLWTRTCMKCGKEIQTTYSPDRPEMVECEECYLREVY